MPKLTPSTDYPISAKRCRPTGIVDQEVAHRAVSMAFCPLLRSVVPVAQRPVPAWRTGRSWAAERGGNQAFRRLSPAPSATPQKGRAATEQSPGDPQVVRSVEQLATHRRAWGLEHHGVHSPVLEISTLPTYPFGLPTGVDGHTRAGGPLRAILPRIPDPPSPPLKEATRQYRLPL